MLVLALELISTFLYAGIFVYAWKKLSQGTNLHNGASIVLTIAVIIHGYLCYLLIDGGEGQDLSLFNIFCMTTWMATCLVGWNLYKHQAYSLLIVTLPVAAISIIEVMLFSSSNMVKIDAKPMNILHIITGVAAMSILLLSALQSVLVIYLDRRLKSSPASIHNWLGPLQGMERYLIQLLTFGFILMSISLSLVLFLPEDLKSAQVMHKVVLTIASWIVLAILMFGRYIRGWRGVFAARWSLVGVFLLLLGYFGSKLVLEFIIK